MHLSTGNSLSLQVWCDGGILCNRPCLIVIKVLNVRPWLLTILNKTWFILNFRYFLLKNTILAIILSSLFTILHIFTHILAGHAPGEDFNSM